MSRQDLVLTSATQLLCAMLTAHPEWFAPDRVLGQTPEWEPLIAEELRKLCRVVDKVHQSLPQS